MGAPAEVGAAAGGGEPAKRGGRSAPKPEPKYPHFPAETCDRLHAVWTERKGPVDYARFRKAFAPLFAKPEPPYPLPELAHALKWTIAVLKSENAFEWRALTPETFVNNVVQYVDIGRQARRDPDSVWRNGARPVAAGGAR